MATNTVVIISSLSRLMSRTGPGYLNAYQQLETAALTTDSVTGWHCAI